MTTTAPQLALTHIVNAPRALVYQAFHHRSIRGMVGPIGNSLPRDEVAFEVRPGGTRSGRRSSRPNPESGTTRPHRPHGCRRRRAARRRHAHHRPPAGGLRTVRDENANDEFYDEAEGRAARVSARWLPEHYLSPSEGAGSRRSPSWTTAARVAFPG